MDKKLRASETEVNLEVQHDEATTASEDEDLAAESSAVDDVNDVVHWSSSCCSIVE